MTHQDPFEASGCYLFASQCAPDYSAHTVFYRADTEALGQLVVNLLTRKFSADGSPAFWHRPVAEFDIEDQVLMDEAVNDLQFYTDPDPGIYDPRSSRDMLFRAQYQQHAAQWERELRERLTRSHMRSWGRSADPAKAREFAESLWTLHYSTMDLLRALAQSECRPQPEIDNYRTSAKEVHRHAETINESLAYFGEHIARKLREEFQKNFGALERAISQLTPADGRRFAQTRTCANRRGNCELNVGDTPANKWTLAVT